MYSDLQEEGMEEAQDDDEDEEEEVIVEVDGSGGVEFEEEVRGMCGSNA